LKIRIGIDYRGDEVGIDTATEPARIALLGPANSAKTTTCRYLIRCWLREQKQVAAVLSPRGHEYRDLPVAQIQTAHPGSTPEAGALLVVDDPDLLPTAALVTASLCPYRIVVFALSGDSLVHDGALAISTIYDVHYASRIYPAPVQGRLDRPPGSVPVRLDPRLPIDFPPHRWAS
jgi:hypothetical protein